MAAPAGRGFADAGDSLGGRGTHPRGKEAATVRRAFFAVVLVAASFAGGAAINSPGLAWARSMLNDQVRGTGRPRADTPARPGTAAPGPKADPADALSDIPSAPAPALVLDAPRLGPPPSAGGKPSRADAEPTTGRDEPWKGDGDGDADARAPEPLDPKALAGLDEAEPKGVAAPAVDRAVDHAGGDRAAGEKGDLRRRMKTLGVTRYWVEGEPGGPSRFRCVIPTAGGRAVGQHFEAEGDDDLQAAEAALRRVALWKATEP